MLKQLKFGLFAVALVGLFASCKNDSEVRDAAEQSVQTGDAATTPSSDLSTTAPGDQAALDASQPAAPAGPTTTMEFNETEFDFGKVKAGEKVTHVYKMKNTGKEPLIISSAKGSCGCTVPKYPTNPIPPGESADITVEFDSKGKSGPQNKKVTITANTNPQQTFIYIKGEVIGDPNQPATTVPQQ